LLGVHRDEMVGVLFRFWVWLDRSTSNGVVTHTSRLGIDSVMHCPGFAGALETVGWGKFDDVAVTLTVPNYDKHNGNPAKSRALGKDRKRSFDERKSNANCVTREEKRREETTTPISAGFGKFWLVYPNGPRKVAKAACAKKWADRKLDSVAEQIFQHVCQMRETEQWRNFCPAPLTYLNQSRWEDGAPAPADSGRSRQVAI
jgi:hypothetical protein